MEYRLFVNDTRTVFVRLWENGKCEVAHRDHPSDTWGPPTYLEEEQVQEVQTTRRRDT